MKARGFTLVELLVILVIIAILAALIFPALARPRGDGRRSACASNVAQIGKAMFMYADVPANKGMFPNMSDDPTHSLSLLYNQYIVDPRVFSCPSTPPDMTKLTGWKPGQPMSRDMSSYGYDPSHSPNDAVAMIAADKSTAGKNSDNHGKNAGQNVLIGQGTIEFRDTVVNNLIPSGEGSDPDIYARNQSTSPEYESYIRQ